MRDFFDFKIIKITATEKIMQKAQGENLKNLLVVIPLSEQTEVLMTFMTKILKAAGFAFPQDVLLLAITPEESFSLSDLLNKADISSIISFGFPPTFFGLDWNLPVYLPYLHEERKFLFADKLTEIEKDKKLKGQLWTALQSLFLSK